LVGKGWSIRKEGGERKRVFGETRMLPDRETAQTIVGSVRNEEVEKVPCIKGPQGWEDGYQERRE